MEEAEDLAQEAFGRAYARWSKVSEHPEPEAWVKLVAFNLAKSRFRRIRVAALKAPSSRDEDPPDEQITRRVDLDRALRALPPRQRAILSLHYIDDIPVKDVARILGASEGSVKTGLHRGRARLSAALIEQGGADYERDS